MINTIFDSSFRIFWMEFKILLKIFENFFFMFKCMELYEPVKLFQAWNRDTG